MAISLLSPQYYCKYPHPPQEKGAGAGDIVSSITAGSSDSDDQSKPAAYSSSAESPNSSSR